MNNGQRTIATLLVLVAALLGGIVIIQTSRPAEAGTVAGVARGVANAGACPSDINGDAFVNVLDLVAVLLDFGTECPGPQLVGVLRTLAPGHNLVVRGWSDGLTEYRVTPHGSPGWEPDVWTPLPVNPDAPASTRLTAINDGGQNSRCYRLWADGTVDNIRFVSDNGKQIAFTEPVGWFTQPN